MSLISRNAQIWHSREESAHCVPSTIGWQISIGAGPSGQAEFKATIRNYVLRMDAPAEYGRGAEDRGQQRRHESAQEFFCFHNCIPSEMGARFAPRRIPQGESG